MSHLSDIQGGNLDGAATWHRINFTKFLLTKYPNTDVEVNADAEYAEFVQKHPKL